MVEQRDATPEGWQVPVRAGLLTGLSFPALLLVLAVGGGLAYNHWVRPRTMFTVTPQPAPGLVAAIHPGGRDPEAPPAPTPPDPTIERAKAEVVAAGLPGWGTR